MVLLNSLMFLLLEMFLEISASYSVSGLYRGVQHQHVEYYALLGQSFTNISGISAVECSVRCLSHHGCFSFNHDHTNQVCQMNNATRGQKCDFFQRMKAFTYYDGTAEPMNCQSNSVPKDENSARMCCRVGKLGLEDGSIPDESLSASSNWIQKPGISHQSSLTSGGRLNKIPPHGSIIGAWHSSIADTNQWIQVDLGRPTYVTGVLTQGRQDHPQWVTKYTVQYQPPSQESLLGVKDHLGQTEQFIGNTDVDIVERQFFEPVLAVKVRIAPLGWHGNVALRFELLGCK